LLFAPIVLLGNQVGALLRYPDIGAAVLFPPYAALTAALVVSSRRDWIWYILVASVAHFVTHWPQWSVSWVLVADLGNIMRALTAVVMLRRLFGGPPRLDSVAALLRFVVSAALVAPAVGATIGAANVVLHGSSPSYWRAWSAWFMSNALTGLTILPAFVPLFASDWKGLRRRISGRRIGEALLLTGTLGATCTVAFLVDGHNLRHVPLPFYSPLPALIWAALRFGPAGASLALSAVTLAAIWGADRQTGPFLALTPDDNVLALQLFVLLTTLPVLCIAVVNAGRRSVVHLYRALLASMHDHVAILDARGIVLEVNDSWRRLADITDVALFHRVRVGDDYVEACRSAADAGDAVAARALAGVERVLSREHLRFEMEYDDDHDGLRERYAVSFEALARLDGGAVVTRTNVTARRQAQIEIEQQRRELSHLARVAVLGQLSGALAHELNQPLASISSNAEAARHLLKRQPPDLEELDAILRDITTEDQRAAQVIRRLRALLKRGDTRLQPMDTTELVTEVLELAHAELITRGVTATASIPPDLPPVMGDRVQLQQVLLNLILNACEAMTSTPAPDRKLALIVSTDARNNVQLSVRDSGTGIPAALIDRLFEPFVTTKSEGLGLGLSISRTIVAVHGGRLWAENNAGRGATVHCLLASAPASAFAEQPRRITDASTPSPAKAPPVSPRITPASLAALRETDVRQPSSTPRR
jgi:signal transduction histidine kinase/integral membrane sensor domain MASE1